MVLIYFLHSCIAPQKCTESICTEIKLGFIINNTFWSQRKTVLPPKVDFFQENRFLFLTNEEGKLDKKESEKNCSSQFIDLFLSIPAPWGFQHRHQSVKYYKRLYIKYFSQIKSQELHNKSRNKNTKASIKSIQNNKNIKIFVYFIHCSSQWSFLISFFKVTSGKKKTQNPTSIAISEKFSPACRTTSPSLKMGHSESFPRSQLLR